MSGGIGRGGDMTLAERVVGQAPSHAANPASTSTTHYTPRHVWVDVTGGVGTREPGVLLEWRRTDDGTWEGHVMWATGGGHHSTHGRIDWLPAHMIEKA